MCKKDCFFLFCVFVPFLSFSQQDPQFSFTNEFNSYVNPSFVINDYKLNVTAQHRQQWVGFEGRPISTLVNASYNIEKAWSGIGVSFLSDQLGAQYTAAALVNYAFDGRIGEHHIIPGIQMGVMFNTLDGSKLNPIDENDPNIISSKASGVAFDIGLSLAYRWRGLAIGFSTKHLNAPTFNFDEVAANSEHTVARHYYAYASYEALLGQHFRLKPIASLKTDAASTQFDAQLWFGGRNIGKVFHGPSIGIGYRIDDAVMVAAEFKLKWFTLGYSYDITTSGINNYSKGSHEMYLRVHMFKATSNDIIAVED
jgi:type IX secretion system PorP/SprF family membrane protein